MEADVRLADRSSDAPPRTLVHALEAHRSPPADVELVHFLTDGAKTYGPDGHAATRCRHRCYFVNLSSNTAETAFLVDATWQGCGLGSAMQRRQVEHAKARGLRGFSAEILPQAHPP